MAFELEVTLFEKNGAVKETGTIERWQSGQDSRTVRTFGGVTQTAVEHDGKSYRDPHQQPIPDAAETLFQAVLSPGPRDSQLTDVTPELRPVPFGKAKLNCIMLSRKMPGQQEQVPLGLFPTYCVSADDHLLVMCHWGGWTTVREGLGKFLGHEVTTKATLSQERVLLAKAEVLELSTRAAPADEFEPGKDLVVVGSGVRVGSSVLAGHKLGGSQPVYPEAERQATYGDGSSPGSDRNDGHVIDLEPMSSPDANFAASALAAVRDWRYSPYLLNGVPTEVTTTITINYNLGSH